MPSFYAVKNHSFCDVNPPGILLMGIFSGRPMVVRISFSVLCGTGFNRKNGIHKGTDPDDLTAM